MGATIIVVLFLMQIALFAGLVILNGENNLKQDIKDLTTIVIPAFMNPFTERMFQAPSGVD
jgi:hypothetical protein